ncbi:MAG: RHS repeat-associated core domain-containing protein, partial [Candidatus Ozemobacteraceae bacterium]
QNEDGETTSYFFSGSDWLVKVKYPDGQQVSYGYNGAGDRISEKTETPTMKKIGRKIVLGTDTVVIPLGYDAGGRLISRASDTFAFDADGNQVTAVENGDETRNFWSQDNRLSRVEKDIECQKHRKKKCRHCPKIFTVAETYGYVPESWKRISRKIGDETFVSLYDGDDESHEYTLETYKERDRKGKCEEKTKLKLIREFIGGPGTDDLVSTKYHGRTLEMLTDGLGSTIAVTNRGGKAVTKIGYDAWGNMRWPDKPGHGVAPCREMDLDDYLERFEGGRSFENAGFDPWHLGRHHGRAITPFLYTGRRFDAFTQTYNNRNRQYSPRFGRFISKDPISFGGGNNLYSYAAQNPLIYTDPWGFSYEEIVGLVEQLGLLPWGNGLSNRWMRDYLTPIAFEKPSSRAYYDGMQGIAQELPDLIIDANDDCKKSQFFDSLSEKLAEELRQPKGNFPDDTKVVRGGINTPVLIRRGMSFYRGVYGVSVQSAPGKTVDELALAGQFFNPKIGVTTVGRIKAFRGEVIPTGGKGYHCTVDMGPGKISPEELSALLQPPRPNPHPFSR